MTISLIGCAIHNLWQKTCFQLLIDGKMVVGKTSHLTVSKLSASISATFPLPAIAAICALRSGSAAPRLSSAEPKVPGGVLVANVNRSAAT